MKYITPGVYIDQDQKRIEQIKITKECIAGFIGLSEKGPINKPVRINSFYQYKKIFGNFTNYSYMSYAVNGFFLCGGRECIIVRVACQNKDDEKISAKKASVYIDCTNSKKSIKIEASSEGTWGNYIQLKLSHASKVKIDYNNPIIKGQDFLELRDTSDFKINDFIVISDSNNREYKKIINIENDKLFFNSKIHNNFELNEYGIKIENVCIDVEIFTPDNHEEYYYLSPNSENKNYFINAINEKSGLIKIVEYDDEVLPEEVFFINLDNGKNGILGITPGDFIGYFNGFNDNKGIGIFDSINDLSVVAAPDVMVFEELIYNEKEKARDDIYAVQNALVNHCEKWGNRFAVLDTPDFDNIIHVLKWREKFDSKAAGIYFPRINIINPEDTTCLTSLTVPPSGHIAGIFAECDEKDGIFRAPANKQVKGSIGLQFNITNDEFEILYNQNINGFRYIPGRGIKVWGAKTLSSDTSWRFINVRRTFMIIQEAIKNGSGWAVFEPNDLTLRKKIVRQITAFLIDLWREGYLTGNSSEEAFFVRCDDELNPPEQINEGRITVEIGIAIAKPLEFLIIKINSKSENSTISLSSE